MRRKVWPIGLLIVIVVASPCLVSALGGEPFLHRMANLDELVCYPEVAPESEIPLDQQLFVTALPGTSLVIMLRPISESEYGSFQIQAIGYDIIELQMLAAAFVLPVVTEGDIAALAPELVEFLKQQVNTISGFEVFDVGGLPSSP